MRQKPWKLGWLGLGLALVWGLAFAQLEVPKLTGRVVDLAGLLLSAQKIELERQLAAFEAEKGSQIAVLIVSTTYPEPIEAYSIRVVEAWKLGRAGVDDGLLILLAVQDRSVRIEVGRGLEGVIPDAVAKRIIEEIMIPKFRQGDFYGGIAAGIAKIFALIRGEPLPAPKKKRTEPESQGVLFLALIMGMFLGQGMKFLLGPLPAALIAGIGAGGIALLAGLSLAVSLFVGGLVFALVLLRDGRPYGWYGGGFGGGGFGNAGFRGGGGEFSGGGASGRW
jgi:uncharacterized protein